MEEQGYIELKIRNKDNNLNPDHSDINEIKEFLSNIESFSYPNRKEKILFCQS